LTKCLVDKMFGWQNVWLTKCLVDKMLGWQNVGSTKCWVDKMRVDKMSGQQNVRSTKFWVYKMSGRRNVGWTNLTQHHIFATDSQSRFACPETSAQNRRNDIHPAAEAMRPIFTDKSSQPGLPDFSWSQYTKTVKLYQMTTDYTKRP
jgi:hypothetical protein